MKCEIDLHSSALACLERNSLSGYCQVTALDGPLWHFMVHMQSSLRGFPRNCLNASLITKSYSGQSRAHLAVSTERVSFRTTEGTTGFRYAPSMPLIHTCSMDSPATSWFEA